MKSVLIDTPLLLDYLRGDKRAQRAMQPYEHRSISVVTWLEVLSICPPEVLDATRGFLRSFERLSISEGIADEALLLMQKKPGLASNRALAWASARVNQLPFVTSDPKHIVATDTDVVMPYRGSSR
jgi:predicted nucleic acid-binding protein